jgi:O-antigen ligase
MIAAAPLLPEAGIVACMLAVAGAFVLRDPRGRAASVLVALVLTPLLLLGDLWDSPQIESLRDRPAVSLAAIAAALGAVAALAALFLRRPHAFPLLCVAALPFRVPVEAAGETANLLVPLYLVVGAGALAYAWRRLREEPPPEREPGAVELALLFMVGLYVVQAAYSTDFDKALENVVFFYVPFALLLKLLSTIDWTARLAAACLVVAVALAVVFVLIGFWEYGTRNLLLNPDVLEANLFKDYFRVNSLFFDPNIYGRFLAIVMIAVGGVLLWTERRRDALWAAALLALLWAGLLLTFSQSSFASLLVGLGTLGLLRWRARPLQLAGGAVALLVVATGLTVSGALNFDPFKEGAIDRATSGRVELLEQGLTMFWERPLQGFGSGTYNERFVKRENVSEERADAASHTIPVTIAAEQGLIGLFSYALVLYAAASVLFRGLGRLRARRSPPWWLAGRAIVAAAFASLVFHTFAYAAFLEDPLTWALLGLGLGFAAAGVGPTAGSAAERAAARATARSAGA